MARKSRAEQLQTTAVELATTSKERLQDVAASSKERVQDVAGSSVERLQEAALDVAAAFPPTAEWAAKRRRRGGWGWLVLGILAGSAIGALLGRLAALRLAEQGADGLGSVTAQARERGRALGTQARQAFERGREHVATRPRADRPPMVAPATPPVAGRIQLDQAGAAPAGGLTAPLRGALDGLKERWRVAVAEGKQAAAETETEMRRRYLDASKRI